MKSFIQTVLIIVCSISVIYSQKASCKVKHKANKNKILEYENIHIAHTFWDEKGIEVNAYADSVVIKKDGKRISGFRKKGNHISDPIFAEYSPDGKLIRYDSLGAAFGWESKQYYGGYTGWMVYSRQYYPSGIPESITYYRPYGKDSLKKKWYPNGTLRETIWSYTWGTDSAIYTFNTEGILQSLKKPSARYEYYPNGILKQSISDTVISSYIIKCTKAYYPAGTLRSVEYNYWGTPCLDWLYYTEQGTLEKNIKKTRITNIPLIEESVGVIMPEEVLTYVEELPQFPGGEYNLSKYLNEKLAIIASESTLPLSGTYHVLFVVAKDGSAAFMKLEGENSPAIDVFIRQIINQIPAWKPGKQHGRPVSTTFRLELKLKEI